MGTRKTIKALGAVVAAWALLVSVPAAPASAGSLDRDRDRDRDRVHQMKKDSGWDIP